MTGLAHRMLLPAIAGIMLCTGTLSAQDETIYMSVLSSRKHGWSKNDNPLIGLFVSNDEGTTWHHRGWREYIRTFYAEEGPDGTIWSACGNGVLRSTDGGNRWRVTTDWRVTEVLKVRPDPGNSAVTFAASAYGVIRTRDRGATWQCVLPRFSSDVWIDRTDGRRVFAATEEGLSISSDRGETWPRAALRGKGVRTIVQNPASGGTLFAGTEDDGIFVSADTGATWQSSSDGLLHNTVYALDLDPRDGRRVFAGTHGGGVYISEDGGKHWTQSSQGLTNLDVHSLVVSRVHPRTVYAGTLNGGLFISTDGGARWKFQSQEDAQVWGLSVSSGSR